MVGMKRDKDGGCAVLGVHAIATVVQPNKRVVAYLAAAENSRPDRAYRPDDVITYRNGVTVEVTNTDAEGRLIAGRCSHLHLREGQPRVRHLATLTGGVVTRWARLAGMFCEDDALRDRPRAGDGDQRRAQALAHGPRVPRHDEVAHRRHPQLEPQPQGPSHPGRGLSLLCPERRALAHSSTPRPHARERRRLLQHSNGWGVVAFGSDFVGRVKTQARRTSGGRAGRVTGEDAPMPSLFVLLWVVGLLCVPGGFNPRGRSVHARAQGFRDGELVCVCGYSLTGLPDGSRCPGRAPGVPPGPAVRPEALGLLTLGEFVLTAAALAVITRDFSLTLVAAIFAWLPTVVPVAGS